MITPRSTDTGRPRPRPRWTSTQSSFSSRPIGPIDPSPVASAPGLLVVNVAIEINHAELRTATPAETIEQMEAQDSYWHQLAWRAGWILGGNAGRFRWEAKSARARQMIRALDRSLEACLTDEGERMEALAHFDAIIESGKRGGMHGDQRPCATGCDHELGSLNMCSAGWH